MVLAVLTVWRLHAGQTIAGMDLMSHYYSSNGSGAPLYEGAVQVATGSRRIASLYAASNNGSIIYLKVQDTANGGTDNGPCVFVVPIAANNFASIAAGVGWKAMTNGIYVAPFTDAACTVSAGSALFYSIDYQ